jgi:hypothetical protein
MGSIPIGRLLCIEGSFASSRHYHLSNKSEPLATNLRFQQLLPNKFREVDCSLDCRYSDTPAQLLNCAFVPQTALIYAAALGPQDLLSSHTHLCCSFVPSCGLCSGCRKSAVEVPPCLCYGGTQPGPDLNQIGCPASSPTSPLYPA